LLRALKFRPSSSDAIFRDLTITAQRAGGDHFGVNNNRQYRPAQPDDWPAIYDLVQAGQDTWPDGSGESRSELVNRLQRPIPDKQVWVAPGAAVAIWFPEIHSISPRPQAGPDDLHLGAFFVAVPLWGSGLADDFIQFCYQQMRAGGAEHVRLWTRSKAGRAQSFYWRQGWSPSGRTVVFKGQESREYTRSLRRK